MQAFLRDSNGRLGVQGNVTIRATESNLRRSGHPSHRTERLRLADNRFTHCTPPDRAAVLPETGQHILSFRPGIIRPVLEIAPRKEERQPSSRYRLRLPELRVGRTASPQRPDLQFIVWVGPANLVDNDDRRQPTQRFRPTACG
mgnify:CR=1 FL=1